MLKIDDNDVQEMITGVQENKILRQGLCGKDLRSVDLSNLSLKNFKKLSFDENTQFSENQIKKFNPYKLLESSKSPGNSIEQLHDMGFTGRGIKIAIIDTNIDVSDELRNTKKIEILENENSGPKEEHGMTVLSSLLQVAPESDILYFADNKYDLPNRDKNRLQYIRDIISKGDVDIISMSSSFDNESIKNEAYKLLQENGITIIDSEIFYENFTYCFREFDEQGNEIFEEAFCEPEDASKEKLELINKDFIGLLNYFNIDSNNLECALPKLKEKLLQEKKLGLLNKLKEFEDVLMCESVEGINGMIHKYKQKIIEEEKNQRKENDSIEVACGGRTFLAKDGKYKYFGTCSASYTIPQVAGMFALAKQADKEVDFIKFVNISKETALNLNGRKVIEPMEIINKLKLKEKDSDFINELRGNVYSESEYVKKESAVDNYTKDNYTIENLNKEI